MDLVAGVKVPIKADPRLAGACTDERAIARARASWPRQVAQKKAVSKPSPSLGVPARSMTSIAAALAAGDADRARRGAGRLPPAPAAGPPTPPTRAAGTRARRPRPAPGRDAATGRCCCTTGRRCFGGWKSEADGLGFFLAGPRRASATPPPSWTRRWPRSSSRRRAIRATPRPSTRSVASPRATPG